MQFNIRLTLDGEIAEEFEAVKKHLQLKANSEVLRSLIRDAFRELPKEGSS